MEEIIKEFLVESYENLDLLDRAMVELEKDPRHKPSLDNVFRTIHTVKGTCGFIAFSRLEKLTHTGENLLSRIREGKLPLTSDRTSGLLAMVDAIRAALAVIESTMQEPQESYDALIQQLIGLTEPTAAAAAPAPAPAPAAAPAPAPKKAAAVRREPSAAAAAKATPKIVPAPVSAPATRAPESASAVAPTPQASSQNQPEATAPKGFGNLSESTIRVDVDVLDKLMNLVGELVLARNQILQFSDTKADKTFLNACQRLNLITTEIQGSFMKTRMQPIENVFGRFPRIIRDLTTELGKKIRLEIVGAETELDRTIIEAIKDPLTHIIRNSVDHGVETPEKRMAAGKAAEGVLKLRAYHEGGQVNIEIADDGAGLNVERLKQKAVDKGLITTEQAERMSEREAFNLIFLPGFSTAEKITNVSGRGVGMDVVRTNIGKIGGSVDVHSVLGAGTTLKIKIPLTLAIIPALVVTSAGDRFAIPQVSLLELVRLDGERARKGIELVHGAPVYRLREKLLPLCYLDRELKIEHEGGAARGAKEGVINIVVLQADGRQFGLVVDAINDTEEIVVKPLGKHLKELDCFAGATIMGDGQVALILDVVALAQRAQVIAEIHDQALADDRKLTSQAGNNQSLLLLDGTGGGRMAIPLSMVARLERLHVSQVEKAASRPVVQYRGKIMPLIHLADYLTGSTGAAADSLEPMHVVVYSEHGRSIGLVVEHISDIVDEAFTLKPEAGRTGILGSAVIQQRVTDLLDLQGIIRAAEPQFFEDEPANSHV